MAHVEEPDGSPSVRTDAFRVGIDQKGARRCSILMSSYSWSPATVEEKAAYDVALIATAKVQYSRALLGHAIALEQEECEALMADEALECLSRPRRMTVETL